MCLRFCPILLLHIYKYDLMTTITYCEEKIFFLVNNIRGKTLKKRYKIIRSA